MLGENNAAVEGPVVWEPADDQGQAQAKMAGAALPAKACCGAGAGPPWGRAHCRRKQLQLRVQVGCIPPQAAFGASAWLMASLKD